MSQEYAGHEPRPLLPDRLEDRLVGSLLRIAGAVLLAVAAAGWLSLITWSAQDPSLTHATSGLTKNWLGPLGAILADLLLQTLGLVAIFAFLAPAFCGGELVVNERVSGLKYRVWLFPLSLLILAGAFSSLPAPKNWPLNHGLGGMAGDAVFNLISGFLAMANPARSGAVTGLALFTAGMCLLSAGLGLSQRDWALLWRPASGRHPGLSGNAGAAAFIMRWANSLFRRHGKPERVPASAAVPNQHGHALPEFDRTFDHPLDRNDPFGMPPSARRKPEPPVVKRELPPADDHDMRDPGFDRSTDISSRSIAQRFAAPQKVETADHPSRKASDGLGGLLNFRPTSTGTNYRRPSLNVLKRAAASRPGPEFTQPVLRGSARLLEDVLNDFSVKGEVKDIRPGPVVTLFELEPARGTKSSRVVALSDDIARSMSATSARVAVVPGRNAIGIELPNMRRETVMLREILEQEVWRNHDGQLPVVLGKSIGGEPIIVDLARMPHLLVAGTTGSGKSVGINVLILSLLYRFSPEECRLLLIDPKMLELSVYNGIPHLLAPVVTDPHQAAGTLAWAVTEMEERYKRMSQLGVRSIEIFNNRVKNAKKRGDLIGRTVQTGFDDRTGQAVYEKERLDLEPMPYIVIVVDEFADLMVVAGKEIEGSVQRLAQMARAAGIHIVMATQRPSVDVVTGTIKANFPSRIAFKVASKIDSRTIIGDQGADQLLGQGDMLYAAGSGQVTRVHGPFVSDEEVERVVEALRENGEPHYAEGLMRAQSNDTNGAQGEGANRKSGSSSADDQDDLFDRAVAIVHRDQKASTSYLQRRLSIGYNRAADLMERMEREGLVSAADAVGRRRILMGGEGVTAEG